MANIARRRIARKLDKSRIYLIHDERLPKRAGTPYTLFIKSRFSEANSRSTSGTAQDTFRAMSEEWRSMSESDKKPFQDAAAAEVETSKAQLKELKEKAKAYWKAEGGAASQVPS
jgi:ribonuclease D